MSDKRSSYIHKPVMLDETLAYMVPHRPNALMADATLGMAGHAGAFLAKYSGLRLIGIDADAEIQAIAKARLAAYTDRVLFEHSYFDDFFAHRAAANMERLDMVLFDFGVSMFHFKESGRGFSLQNDEPLDMRLDTASDVSAADIVNGYDERLLFRLISDYGEEPFAMAICRAIARERRKAPIATTLRLAEIVRGAVPPAKRYGRIHPATKTFQALRIAVNDELGRIERGLNAAIDCMAPGGLIACISFHSLEDRIVKQTMRARFIKEGESPINKGRVGLVAVTKKPLEASDDELAANQAARSAKLRVACAL